MRAPRGRALSAGISDPLLALTARAYHPVLKIARIVADLAGADEVGADHVADAIQYRSLDWRRAAVAA